MRKANGAAEPSMDEILASIRQIIESSDSERMSARDEDVVHSDPVGVPVAAAANWNGASDAAYALRPSYEGSAAYELGAYEPGAGESWYAAETTDTPAEEAASEGWDDGALSEALAAGADEPVFAAHVANNDEPRMRDYRDAILHDQRLDDALADAEPLISQESEAAISASFAELTEAIRNGELRSLEEMAQDMLRPMMQQWLEENLARTVQEIVREEIRRSITRGR